MDSWFMMPAAVTALNKHIDITGMVKKTSKIHYQFNGHWADVKTIYRQLKKRRDRAKILASSVVRLKGGSAARIVFVRKRRKKDCLVLLSTDLELSNKDNVRICFCPGKIESKQIIELLESCSMPAARKLLIYLLLEPFTE